MAGKFISAATTAQRPSRTIRQKFEAKVRRQLAETGQVVQVACPVTGQPVNKDVTVEVGHAKVGFCCKNCLAKYNAADDDGKLKLVFADLDKGFTRQTKCPVSGKPINAEATVEYEGKKVYFCCPNCPAAFEAEPAKFWLSCRSLPKLSEKRVRSDAGNAHANSLRTIRRPRRLTVSPLMAARISGITLRGSGTVGPAASESTPPPARRSWPAR